MNLSAPDFLEMWRDSLALAIPLGASLIDVLFEDAACAGIAENALREAAGGDIETYLAIS